ncbi:MAG TPA: hypothetical protein VFU88_04860 [Ktedonobacterales bacterium]|nr:hypothetical protein [Ktedonobacterales bacterium]
MKMTLMRTMARVWRRALTLTAMGMIVGLLLMSSAGTALADYGKGAVYQIEISGNCVGATTCIPGVVKGYGIWFWAELDADGTGDYQAADCGHGYGANGAFHDSGDVTWSTNGTTLTITGVAIFGNSVPITITVPVHFGHYMQTFAQVFDVPALGGALPGWAQVQVAP